jgi:hypothetical protein
VIEQVVVNVEGESEWVEIHVHWAGGHQTYSRVRRPVAGTMRLSRWAELKGRLLALKSTGLSSREIADHLHAEGFRPAKGPRVTAEVVRVWLSRHGLCKDRKQLVIDLAINEWTIPQIMDTFHIAAGTVYGWIRRSQVRSRQLDGVGGRWIVQATQAELETLINNRRKRPQTVDLDEGHLPTARKETVSRGAL